MVKRTLNLFISIMVRTWDLLAEGAGLLVGRSPRARCVVLAYHAVTPAERSRFGAQMDILLRFAKPVPADVSSLPAGGGKYAAVTFDDGFENICVNALPELEERKIPSTFFIVSGFLGQTRSWEHRGGEDTTDEQVITEEQLRRLSSDLVTVGSHTMTHAFLPHLTGPQLQAELSGSRIGLGDIVGKEVKLLSFPYGAYNDAVVEGCRKAGYTRVFTALPTFAFSQADEFVSGRVGTAATDWPIEFHLKLAGAYRWLPSAFRFKRILRSALRA